jgi:hypothetical protein
MKKYIYSPQHQGLVLAPLMEKPDKYFGPTQYKSAEEAYNTWLSSPPIYKVRPEDIKDFLEPIDESQFEVEYQVLTMGDWRDTTKFVYDQYTNTDCKRIVAIPKKGNESKEQIPSVDLDQVVYVAISLEGGEIPPWGDSNLYLLYDNGEIINHLEDEQPFAICTHWLKKTTIRELIQPTL